MVARDAMYHNNKVQINARISEEIAKSFKELVVAKHGKIGDGMLSYEVETALNQYIVSYGRIDTQKNKKTEKQPIGEIIAKRQDPFPKIYRAKQQVIDYLLSHCYDKIPQCIGRTDLQEAIGQVKGLEKRTIDKWIGLFLSCHCMKCVGPNQFEFV